MHATHAAMWEIGLCEWAAANWVEARLAAACWACGLSWLVGWRRCLAMSLSMKTSSFEKGPFGLEALRTTTRLAAGLWMGTLT